MARGKDQAKRLAEEEARRRRNSAAHRSLRRRAQKGAGARSVHQAGVEDSGVTDGDSSVTDPPQTAVEPPSSDTAADATTPVTSENDVDRVATSELEAPAWLAAGAAATAGSSEDAYTPRYEPTQDAEVVDDAAVVDDAEVVDDAVREDDVPGDGRVAPERSSMFAQSSEHPVHDADETLDDAEATTVHAPIGDTAVMAPVADDHADREAASTDTESSQPAATSMTSWTQAEESSDEDTVTDDDGHGNGRKRRRAAWAVPLVLVGVAVLYVGAQALLSTTVPRGTEVMGMDVGGMSTTEATAEISEATSALESEELSLRAGEQSFSLPASDAGLSIDVDSTLAEVTGFTLAPDRLWAHISGGGPTQADLAVDEDALADAVEIAAVQLDGPSQDAGVTVADGAVEVVAGRSAVTVDQEASAALIAESWPGSTEIDLVADTSPPAITDEDAGAFAAELETQTFAAPITLIGDDAEATIEPATIAASSTVASGAGGLELVIDGEALAAQIIEANPALTTEGDNASVSFDDSQQIVIDEGSPGITIDREALGEAVTSAAGSAERTAELPYTAADPEVSAEDLGVADFKEVISSFDTPLTADAVRTQNLRVAAADVQGTVVLPGETFDLTDALSPINAEEGYQDSGVIVNGVLTSGMGGGLSQMATTAYNAGYFAGYEILDHRPHSVWFTRYPAGRESTIYTGSINVEFRNNTPYAAVFNSYIAGDSLHVEVWSTEHFEVTTSASPKTDIKEPGVKDVSSENCSAKSAGQPGFTITNTRTVYLDEEEVDQTSDTWTYQPDDAIRCVSEDESDDD